MTALLILHLKYESLRLLRSPAIWLLLAFLLTSISFATYNGLQRIARQQQSIDTALARQQDLFKLQQMQVDSIDQKLKKEDRWWLNPSNPLVVGGLWQGGHLWAIKPTPHNVLAVGMSDLSPVLWRISIQGKEPKDDSKLENPANQATGDFDLAFVIVFLLPLLVITASFNLVSNEREQGTLALLQAQPLSFAWLFFYKMLARFCILSLLILFTLLPALAYAGIPLLSTSVWGTLATAILYALFWFLVALGINLHGGTSVLNALLCVCAWLLLTIVSPVLINSLAQKIYPLPSRAGFQTALRSLENQLEASREQRIEELYRQNQDLRRKPPAERDWKDWYREEFALSEGEKLRKDSLELAFFTNSASHSAFTNSLLPVSPVLCVYSQLTHLSGTDQHAFNVLSATLDTKQSLWKNWFIRKFNAGQSIDKNDFQIIMSMYDSLPSYPSTALLPGFWWLLLQCGLAAAFVGFRGAIGRK